ncbi:OmpA family protein [Pyxidicoccus xibeiensis]|uniref:OmpA family protein n=1 Tax=Pyxidicoccus xibeiensis TaxID=2906759 RepID=UPI0020A80B5D|nr:OmpA family protein [Pyxidicoccus xibeiensis]MCP3137769.1 OmpA family protein [Pyxidicoccus xibeiensis]
MVRLALLPALLLTLQASAASPEPAAAAPEVNALALLTGARVLDGQGRPTNDAYGMLDGELDSQYDPAVSSNPPRVIELAEPFDLTRLEVINSKDEKNYPGISVKTLRVEHGPSHKGPWQPLAELELKKGREPQSKPVSAKKVRYLRVTLVANHGSKEWIGLSALRAWGQRSEARKIDFTGTWRTAYGEMQLTQTGQRITGCYGQTGSKAGNNTVDGTLEGTVFFGLWREVQDGGNDRSGPIAFALTQEGGLAGVYGSGKSESNTRWDGEKLAKATITCTRPEAGLSEELKNKGRVVLHGILFDTGKDTIRGESVPVLEALAAAMKETPDVSYRIEGHTDDRGGEAFNKGLSDKRAASVKKWLVGKGIPDKQLQTEGLGMSKPTMPNDTEAGRAANRRVEVVRSGG